MVVAAARSVAVIGGLCGLSTSLHLLRLGASVRIYDDRCLHGVAEASGEASQGYYATASAAAGGILHPMTPKLKLAWEGAAALAGAEKLVSAASARAGRAVSRPHGLVRPCLDEAEAATARERIEKAPDWLEWVEQRDLDELLGSGAPANFGGVRYLRAQCVEMQHYLPALWGLCEDAGATWEQKDVADPRDLLSAHDAVVCCGGAEGSRRYAALFDENERSQITLTRGQSVLFKQSNQTVALLHGEYFVPDHGDSPGILGATHEHVTTVEDTPPEKAEALLEGALGGPRRQLVVGDSAVAVASTAGVRLNGPRTHFGRLPFVSNPHPNVWVATGLGARGLLRHAQLGESVATAALHADALEGLLAVPAPLRLQHPSEVVEKAPKKKRQERRE